MSRKAVLVFAGVILGCSAQKPADPKAGQIKLSTTTTTHLATTDGTAPDVCGTFTLQPYSLDANGNQTLSGSPQIVHSSVTGQTDAILGCVEGPPDSAGDNWGYLVTATSFVDCTGGVDGGPISGLAPGTVTGSYPVDCKAGVDTSLSINVDVSIPEANGAGYIDVSVGVNSTEVQAGCKEADIDGGTLHFGQSYVQTSSGLTPSAYTGIGVFTPSKGDSNTGTPTPAGSVRQFVGSVQAGSEDDVYFTGILTLPDAPQSATLVQAFAQPCPTGDMTVQPHAVECVTQATLPNSTSTQVQIADVFASWPGHGSVSASMTGSNTISLDTSLGGPNLGTLTPPVTGYDALTYTQNLTVSDPVIGLYGSLVHSDELLALAQDPTLGPSLVVLTLDEATGQWSAGSPISLSNYTLAQQQSFGLYGSGGCFPEPIPVCASADSGSTSGAIGIFGNKAPHHGARPAGKSASPDASPDDLSASATVSLAHGNGDPVDASHPVVTDGSDSIVVHIQWSASGLTAGQFAYAAFNLCDPFGSISTTAGAGGWIGASCNNGYGEPIGGSSFAFTPQAVDNGGGVAEDFQFTIAPATYFVDQTNWTIPVSVYVTTANSPTAATGDVSLLDIAAPPITLVPHYEAMTVETIRSTTPVSSGGPNNLPGYIFTIAYAPTIVDFRYTGYLGHYLDGASTITLSPPAIGAGINAWLVPGSATESTTSLDLPIPAGNIDSGYGPIITTKSINSGLTPITITADAIHGGIPTATIDNLAAFASASGYGPSFTAQWYIPLPTAQGTTFTYQGSIDWSGGSTFTDAAIDPYPNHNSFDISPVPVADLFPNIDHVCNEPVFSGYTNEGPDTSCHWVYNWNGVYEIEAYRGTNINNASPNNFLNPTYVIKLDPNEQISSTYIGTTSTVVSTSNDTNCSNATLGDSTWTVQGSPQGPADWSAVRCVAYKFSGFISSPGLDPFTVELNPSIRAGAALLATQVDTTMFWATADNVTPDSNNNAWAMNTLQVTWKNTTDLYVLNYYGNSSAAVSPYVVTHSMLGDAAGVDVPDLTVTITLANGAFYTYPAAHPTPESWFGVLPVDTSGAHCTVQCTPQSDPRIMSCVISPTAGEMIVGRGGWDGSNNPNHEPTANLFDLTPEYSFNASEVANGEGLPINVSLSTSAAWLANGSAAVPVNAPAEYDTVSGINSLSISKTVSATIANAGATVPFDISYGSVGLANSGDLGAGGVAVYDFFGSDYLDGTNGAVGTIVAQSSGCVAPVPVSVSYVGTTNNSATPPAPTFYYTASATPDTTSATTWTAFPAGAIPAGATAIKIVPTSSFGNAGVLLPIDGDEMVEVDMAAPSGSTGLLCNSAALSANLFDTSATPEAQVPLTPPCDANPWPTP